MPLTHQPFAEAPELKDLDRELHMNISNTERGISAVLGIFLAVEGFERKGIFKWPIFILTALALHRSLSGRCRFYESIGIDKRHL